MTDESMEELATEAWIYGYPLVTAALTKNSMTAVPARYDARRKAPVNQFCYMRATRTPRRHGDRAVVRPFAEACGDGAARHVRESTLTMLQSIRPSASASAWTARRGHPAGQGPARPAAPGLRVRRGRGSRRG